MLSYPRLARQRSCCRLEANRSTTTVSGEDGAPNSAVNGASTQILRAGEARIVQYALANKKLKRTTLKPRFGTLKRINKAVNLQNWKANILDHEYVAGWLEDPETLGLGGKKPSPNTKYKWLQDLNAFYGWAGIKWTAPDLKRVRTQPYLPPLQSILFLIHMMTQLDFKQGVFLQTLKETAARAGEAWMLKWSEIEFRQRIVTIATPEKGSRSRTRAVSQRLIDMLNLLRKTDSPYVFHRELTDPAKCTDSLDDFRRQFERLRKQLDGQYPAYRLRAVHFHSFRTWRATWEYYQTKDVRHVMDLLGVVNPWLVNVYVQLAQAILLREDDYDVKQAKCPEEATELGSMGYQKYDEFGEVHLYRKLKFLVEEPLKFPTTR